MRNTLIPLPALQQSPPHVVGPTWQRLEDGRFFLPEKTLGWALLNWMHHYLRDPSDPSRSFLPTAEQARFLLWWYAVDERGRYAYRNGVLRRLKGWGKDPLVAAMSLAELCGPVAFSHFDDEGNPIGKRRPAAWIQVAAVSQDQTNNTFRVFPLLITQHLKTDFQLEVNKTIIYASDGALIEAVTASPNALEGKRTTFVVLNEIQWWFQANQGHDMYSVIEGNVTKMAGVGARFLAICNAHRPGEESVGERLWDTHQSVAAGEAVDTGMLYDALEAPADTPISEIPPADVDPDAYRAGLAQLEQGIRIARGDATWLDPEITVQSILDINNPVSESRRKHLNQINASEDAWIAAQEWDDRRIFNADLKLEPGDRITLGFDGSKSNDWTALVACRVDDGALFLLGVWDPEKYDGQIPREDVDAAVRSAFERYDVMSMRADVREFEAYVDQWSKDFKRQVKVNASPANPIAFDMRGQAKRFALDAERFLDAVLEHELCHDGNKTLRRHILNAHRYPTKYDSVSIRKASKDSPRKIDAAVCAVLAYGARHEFLMSKKNRTGRATVMR